MQLIHKIKELESEKCVVTIKYVKSHANKKKQNNIPALEELHNIVDALARKHVDYHGKRSIIHSQPTQYISPCEIKKCVEIHPKSQKLLRDRT
jgi:hypothetical protein